MSQRNTVLGSQFLMFYVTALSEFSSGMKLQIKDTNLATASDFLYTGGNLPYCTTYVHTHCVLCQSMDFSSHLHSRTESFIFYVVFYVICYCLS